MARVHILQHAPFEGPGCILPWLQQRGHQIRFTRLYAGESLPDASELDWLIVLGGPMGIYDYCEHPWLYTEKDLIRQAIDGDRVVLGICLGAQLIADVLRAPVSRGGPEIGWFPLAMTVEAMDSPFGRVLAEAREAFHWHKDAFGIPEGAVHLARSVGCDHQAFSFGERVLALQCHLELNAPGAATLCRESGEKLNVSNPWVQSPEEILRREARFTAANRVMYKLLARLEAAMETETYTASATLASTA